MISSKNIIVEIYAFSKAQVSAFIGGLVDFIVMIAVVELFGLHYIVGIILGGLIGAYVNFTINREWTFSDSSAARMSTQLRKFAAVVIGSILMKSTGTYCLSEGLKLDYKIARLVADALVCFGFNYVLQRYWVFGSKK